MEFTECPNCYQSIPVRSLRQHLNDVCSDRLVRCNKIGCEDYYLCSQRNEHLQYFCKPAIRQKTLVKHREREKASSLRSNSSPILSNPQHPIVEVDDTRNDQPEVEEEERVSSPVVCMNCSETFLSASALINHRQSECKYRMVYCPNRNFGCPAEIPISGLRCHLREECIVEKHNAELISNSKLRHELVNCIGCNKAVQLQNLRSHEAEDCENRKVPCRNSFLGCQIQLRLKEKHIHENVELALRPRSCFFFDGVSTHLSFEGEEDIPPPWTFECWVYRPAFVETLKCNLKRAHVAYSRLVVNLCEEYKIKLFNDKLKEDMEASASRGENIEESSRQLSSQIKLLEDIALESVKLSQIFELSARASLNDLDRFIVTNSAEEILDPGLSLEESVVSNTEELVDEFPLHLALQVDWSSKPGVAWKSLLQQLLKSYSNDKPIIRTWRINGGLIRKPDSTSKSTKQNGKEKEKRNRRGSKRGKDDVEQKNRRVSMSATRKFEDKEAELIRLYSGLDVLLQSSESSIFLTKLPDDKNNSELSTTIGFSHKDLGCFSFGFTILKESWTHLAFVCNGQSIKCYNDGVNVGKPINVATSLPFKTIGSSYLSFLGYCLDIRFWNRARSAVDIKLSMSVLIEMNNDEPVDVDNVENNDLTKMSVKKATAGVNLCSWLNFDSPTSFHLVRDLTDKRYPLKVDSSSAKSCWVPVNEMCGVEDDALTVPSYAKRFVCPFEVRRARLAAKGRKLYNPVTCPMLCKQIVRAIDLKAHMNQECENRMLTCRFSFCCNQTFPACCAKHHYEYECETIKSRNEWLDIRNEKLMAEGCSVCSEKVPMNKILHHMRNECIYRTVTCPEPGCGMTYEFCEEKEHIKFFCRGFERMRTCSLIERARARMNYPRPWALDEHHNKLPETTS